MNKIVEIAFNDGEAGALLEAAERDERFGEVVCLEFMADIGDIKKPMGSEYRRKLIEGLLFQGQWGQEYEGYPSLETGLSEFRNKLSNSTAVRVWVSDCAYSRCGFLYLCSLLENYGGEVYAVKLSPAMSPVSGNVIQHCSWGEAEPVYFRNSLSRGEIVPESAIKACARKWEKLQDENTPLRAVVGGEIISVPVNFYDFLIRKYLSEPMKEAVLIGKILAGNRIGVPDYWYAKRIENMIHSGKIRVVKDDERKYNRVIERAEV